MEEVMVCDKNRLKRKSIAEQKTKERRDTLTEKMTNKYLGLEFGSYIVTVYLGRLKEGNSKYERYYFEKECKFCGSISKNTPSELDNHILQQPKCIFCKESLNIHTKEKKCNCCNTWFPATSEFFPLSKNRPFGIHYYCKTCHLSKNRKRRESKEVRTKEYEYYSDKYKTDPFFRLKNNLRARIRMALRKKGWKKNGRTTKLIGTDFETVHNHLELKFQEGMNWDNHGTHGWHIDHIIPLAVAQNEEELYKLFHYTNLQPLWAFDNISKGGRE